MTWIKTVAYEDAVGQPLKLYDRIKGPDDNVDNIMLAHSVGWEDGEILEINQVAAYFNYANRTVLGLGINTDADILGLSPGDSADSTNWRHQ